MIQKRRPLALQLLLEPATGRVAWEGGKYWVKKGAKIFIKSAFRSKIVLLLFSQ